MDGACLRKTNCAEKGVVEDDFVGNVEGGYNVTNGSNVNVMATMTHIDGPGYNSCLRDAVMEHFQYYSKHGRRFPMDRQPGSGNDKIEKNDEGKGVYMPEARNLHECKKSYT